MRQQLSPTEYNDIPPYVKDFIVTWKRRKRYTDETLTLGQCWELLTGISRNLHMEFNVNWADKRFFNYVLANEDSMLAWEGIEPIESIWYEIVKILKRDVATAGTFNSDILE